MNLLWSSICSSHFVCVFFFTAPAPTEIYTLSLHDALPISAATTAKPMAGRAVSAPEWECLPTPPLSQGRKKPTRSQDRKSTRLNSSHTVISYAVFCLKKKKEIRQADVDTHGDIQRLHGGSP